MLKKITFLDDVAVDELEKGNVIALPTDTVYGFAIKYDDEKAYKKLIDLKGRDPLKPISVMFSSIYDYSSMFDVNEKIQRVVKAFLPGALTIIVKSKSDVPYQTHLGTYKIGFRISADKDLDNFLKRIDYPLQVTSANKSGKAALFDVNDVIAEFEDNDNLSSVIIGKCKSKIATTVVDLSDVTPQLIRKGEVPFDEILNVYYG